MDIFRFIGDLSHLIAIKLLLYKIIKSRSISGLSAKSQVLFFLVFISRYVDLFLHFVSAYNTIMKVIYILSMLLTVYLILVKYRHTYNSEDDSFRAEILVICCGGLACLINYEIEILEILWTFSIYLESVAILPQLYMISKRAEAETITSHYIFALGMYRLLYVLHWIYVYYDSKLVDVIAVVAGVIQTILYSDFFYIYVTKLMKGKKLKLPV
ncbi:ER lumen protein-retaining receptor [Intoshia linei]|uniref:ER lumen protein-retaining receptor n=1 Tax=Intoshia linei TaxID=1819745 RepID=A0A177BC11_9BILA|nr:ER lumen protein-retaining receptor [Intoshia linei]